MEFARKSSSFVNEAFYLNSELQTDVFYLCLCIFISVLQNSYSTKMNFVKCYLCMLEHVLPTFTIAKYLVIHCRIYELYVPMSEVLEDDLLLVKILFC